MTKTFIVTKDHIELGQLLKATDVVGSGGEVKEYLGSHEVRVNGEIDNRRGRKIRAGDVVTVEDYLTIKVS
ncbi:MAG: RNA-binding S4 domain-containing protein [Armatimonadota bacterium]